MQLADSFEGFLGRGNEQMQKIEKKMPLEKPIAPKGEPYLSVERERTLRANMDRVKRDEEERFEVERLKGVIASVTEGEGAVTQDPDFEPLPAWVVENAEKVSKQQDTIDAGRYTPSETEEERAAKAEKLDRDLDAQVAWKEAIAKRDVARTRERQEIYASELAKRQAERKAG